ncbi:MAG: undecaprenyl-diphosphate phosphatase, partial [Candidatus Omnitrophica bacterium]|nr:undecaprenyl-diphosphate phosphatase [Candidatus Omnitrophota bacterium]
PAVIAALLFEDRIEKLFTEPAQVAYFFLATGLVLLVGQFFLWKKKGAGKGPAISSSFSVGVAQAFALLPGISRSGTTISAGLASGMKAEEAFRFSFLLSVPAILGALLYKSLKMDAGTVVSEKVLEYGIGMFAAFIVGLLSLRILWWVIKSRKLYIFAIYCLLLGTAGIVFWK